jgi:26S proteasome regulatory subunit, ATPase 3, interacting protein
MEADWKKYRTEWIARKKIFKEYASFSSLPHSFPVMSIELTLYYRLWGAFTEAMTPSEAADLKEDLGIEFDSEEHVTLEKLLGPGAQTSFRRRK